MKKCWRNETPTFIELIACYLHPSPLVCWCMSVLVVNTSAFFVNTSAFFVNTSGPLHQYICITSAPVYYVPSTAAHQRNVLPTRPRHADPHPRGTCRSLSVRAATPQQRTVCASVCSSRRTGRQPLTAWMTRAPPRRGCIQLLPLNALWRTAARQVQQTNAEFN